MTFNTQLTLMTTDCFIPKPNQQKTTNKNNAAHNHGMNEQTNGIKSMLKSQPFTIKTGTC